MLKTTKYRFNDAVLPLIGTNVVVFMFQIILGSWFTELFLLNSADILSRPWILVTSMFLHADFSHILFNMYGLFLFGMFLQQVIGPKRVLLIFFVTGIFASFVASFFYPKALGASGALMGVIGALIVLMPNLKLLLFFVVPMPLWVAGILYAAIDIFGTFNPSGVGNIVHLAGLFAGLMFGLYYKKKGKKFKKKFSEKTVMSQKDIDEYYKYGRI